MSSIFLLKHADTSALLLTTGNTQLLTHTNIASIAVCIFTLALSIWCLVCRCSGHVDKLRCRVIIMLALSTCCYSICQITLVKQAASSIDSTIVRVVAFISNWSIVLNIMLVSCAIGFDAAVRYGLHSFGLARRLSCYYEILCFILSLGVSQPLLYLFNSITWSGSSIVIDSSSEILFRIVVWTMESGWISAAISLGVVFIVFTIAKARKMTRSKWGYSNTSVESVLGTASSIKGRVWIATSYMVAFTLLFGWRIAFRVGGSQSIWILFMASMGESLQAPVTLGIFILDIFVNINRRPEWLRSATSSMESINISKIDQSNVSRSSNRNLTSWRKTRFLNGQQELKGSDSKEALKSQYVATLSWVEAVSQCHIRSETSGYYPQTESCGRSDASFDGIIECYSGPMVMYPLTK